MTNKFKDKDEGICKIQVQQPSSIFFNLVTFLLNSIFCFFLLTVASVSNSGPSEPRHFLGGLQEGQKALSSTSPSKHLS